MRLSKVLLLSLIVLTIGTAVWAEIPIVANNTAKIGGYTRLRYLILPKESDTFRFDELSLTIKNDFNERVFGLVGALIYGGNTFYLEHAFLGIKGLPLNGMLYIGQTRNYAFGLTPTGGNRKTTNYGIVSDVFTHDRILGVQYLGKVDKIDLSAAVYNGYAIANRAAGEGVSRVNFLADRDSTLGTFQGRDASDNKEVAARVGVSNLSGFSAGLSGSVGRLSAADLTFMKTNVKADYDNRTKNRFGLDAKYNVGALLLQGEFYQGKTSELSHNAWQALVFYKIPCQQDKTVDVYGRYGMVTPDITATASSYTWELRQTVAGVIYYFTKSIWLQTELEFNDESPLAGIEKIDNDVYFTELFVGF
ncbi:MAG: hypothetical protein PHH44_04250 [bacterium]|nr:hypothetical protein [bacterium]